jgi:protein gp37
MPMKTKIPWCDYTSNPIRARDPITGKLGWHCVKKSAGCLRCYAEGINRRFGTGLPYAPSSCEPFLNDEEIDKLLKSRAIAGKRLFLVDMSDPFGDWVPDAWLDKLFAVMALRPDVTFITLTKRAKRMYDYTSRRKLLTGGPLGGVEPWKTSCDDVYRIVRETKPDAELIWPLPNWWPGVSAENQLVDDRIEWLFRTPAAKSVISIEPMIGPVDLVGTWQRIVTEAAKRQQICPAPKPCPRDSALSTLKHILSWVIIGPESGPSRRPFDVAAARGLIEDCQAAAVPCFVKAWPVGKIISDNPEQWPAWARVQQFPEAS